MELGSLHSPIGISIHSSLTQTGLGRKLFLNGQIIKIHSPKRCQDARKVKFSDFRAQSSGTKRFGSMVVEAIPKDVDIKDEDLIFVAGATGKVGSRTVRELLKLGFKVRAGVRSAQRAESLVQSVKKMNLDINGAKPIEKLEIVECDLEKRDQIAPALGSASVIICCIGASEKEIFDITGPYRIDFMATKNLIDSATVAKVDHFILLTSLGTNKVGFPAAILNLFWGVLIWKRKAEEALLASGLSYTIVRPGGMERPTDAYKETHNITLSLEDTLFGGQVSNLQVAELMAIMAKNRKLAYCKVVEVIAETTAPLTPMEKLLENIPSQRAELYPPKKSDKVVSPEAAASKNIVSEAPSTPETELAEAKPISSRPLSPYIAYEDLKPPTSPTPIPSIAKASNTNAIAAAPESVLSSSQNNLPEPSSTVIEKEAAAAELKKTSPLSPYVNYYDLRPPSSPMPNQPVGQRDADITEPLLEHTGVIDSISTPEEVQKTSPLSPYTAYEDLKPPCSPSPTPSVPKTLTNSVPAPAEDLSPLGKGIDEVKTTITKVSENDYPLDVTFHFSPYHISTPEEEVQKTSPLSPYTTYEDLKPPCSPSPTPSVPKTLTNNGPAPAEDLSPLDKSNDVVKTTTTKVADKDYPLDVTFHLSPYHMYEDLKPPSSPTPTKP